MFLTIKSQKYSTTLEPVPESFWWNFYFAYEFRFEPQKSHNFSAALFPEKNSKFTSAFEVKLNTSLLVLVIVYDILCKYYPKYYGRIIVNRVENGDYFYSSLLYGADSLWSFTRYKKQ